MFRSVGLLISLAAIVMVSSSGCGSASSEERKVKTIVLPKAAKAGKVELKGWKQRKPASPTG